MDDPLAPIPFTSSASAAQVAALESFSGVLRKIEASWGTSNCNIYLQSLFMDSRGGTRQGFPLEVGEELLFLVRLNKNVRALQLADNLDMQFDAAFRQVDAEDQRRQNESMGGDAWIDPNNAMDVFASSPAQSRLGNHLTYEVVRPPKKKNSSVLSWIIAIALLALAYKLLAPTLLGSS